MFVKALQDSAGDWEHRGREQQNEMDALGQDLCRLQFAVVVKKYRTIAVDEMVQRLNHPFRNRFDRAQTIKLANKSRNLTRPGDPTSARSEFTLLKSKGLLTDMTVIVHGTGLEAPDFIDMRAAQSIRSDGTGDGLGAKLV